MKKKHLAIQIKPNSIFDKNKMAIIDNFLNKLINFSSKNNFSIKIEKDNINYINILITSNELDVVWFYIESLFKSIDLNALLSGIIVVCEGKKGWSDYKQLYHYDKSQIIDSL